MKFWFDTEFYENGKIIELISIGIVAEDGREYYAEVPFADATASCTAWLRENVLPHLTYQQRPRALMQREIVEFVGKKPEFWAYYAAYDWVALCQLFGTMMDLPKGWPMYCRDLKQIVDAAGNPHLPAQTEAEHNALCDARWTKHAWLWLRDREMARAA